MNLSCQEEPAYGLVTAGQDSETSNRIPHQRRESGRSFTVAREGRTRCWRRVKFGSRDCVFPLRLVCLVHPVNVPRSF